MIETSKLREQYAIPTPNLVLLSLYIDHILYEEFQKLESLAKQLFLNETNISVKMLFLDKTHDFYQVCQGSIDQKERIEDILLSCFEVVFRQKLALNAMVFIDENHQTVLWHISASDVRLIAVRKGKP